MPFTSSFPAVFLVPDALEVWAQRWDRFRFLALLEWRMVLTQQNLRSALNNKCNEEDYCLEFWSKLGILFDCPSNVAHRFIVFINAINAGWTGQFSINCLFALPPLLDLSLYRIQPTIPATSQTALDYPPVWTSRHPWIFTCLSYSLRPTRVFDRPAPMPMFRSPARIGMSMHKYSWYARIWKDGRKIHTRHRPRSGRRFP